MGPTYHNYFIFSLPFFLYPPPFSPPVILSLSLLLSHLFTAPLSLASPPRASARTVSLPDGGESEEQSPGGALLPREASLLPPPEPRGAMAALPPPEPCGAMAAVGWRDSLPPRLDGAARGARWGTAGAR